MSKAILVANWKNFPKSKEETARLLSQLARQGAIYKKRAVYIAPPFTYFESVASKVSSFASLATQDVPLPPDGVHTGEITADILRSFGTKLAILGHSERRAMGESNQVMAGKVRLAIRSGFKALVCVGEEVRDQDGQYFEFLKEQIKASLAGCKKLEAQKSLIVAYEPVWAIGDKALGSIKPEDLAQTVIFIKKILTEIFGRQVADKIPVLYGGSVDRDNARALLKQRGVKGFLVGRASLNGQTFSSIAETL